MVISMKQKMLQLGSDNFGKVISKNLKFVDKTLFIKEVFDNDAIEVSIITRPRRFGKTFNLSMLHHFLAPEVNSQATKDLFTGLKIATADNGAYMQYQGQYPVIFISFKDIESKTFAGLLDKLRLSINELYRTHEYLLKSTVLESHHKDLFKEYLANDLTEAKIGTAIKNLSELIFKHYSGKKVYILIDEYDTPIQSGYMNQYYDQVIELIRDMFGRALKSNPYLERGVITGILRIAKESLFSHLNNPKLYTIMDKSYSSHFGFTEAEVHQLLIDVELTSYEAQVKTWYNGYNFGGTTVYNPWSIVSFIDSQGILMPYWVNTSGNDLIKKMLLQADLDFKEHFELLLQDQIITKPIDSNLVFGNLDGNTRAAWSLLAMSGYLKILGKISDSPTEKYYYCAIPNLEVKDMYCEIIKTWLGGGELERCDDFLQALLTGNIPVVAESLQTILLQLVSSHDMARKPEAFYHGLWLGLLAGLDAQDYDVRSNQESGLGRYDIAIFPKNTTKPAIIMELKSLVRAQTRANDHDLTAAANEALAQIKHKQYDLDAKKRGFTAVIKIGVAFAGKACTVVSNHIVAN